MTDQDLAVATFAESHHGVFSARDLREMRIDQGTRDYRLRAGRWVAVHDGVYRIAGAPTTVRGLLRAACLAGGPRAAVSFRAAASMHALPGRDDAIVEITCPRWRRAQHDGLLVHESRALSERDVTVVDGIRVTNVERTIFDLCAVRGPRTVDLAIDNALRRGLTSFDALARTLRRVGKRGRKGTSLMRALLAARDPAYRPSESEREQLMLDVILHHGLPLPVRQVEVRDEFAQFVARVDLAYPKSRIAIEYDSYQEHVGKVALVRDSRRRNAMTALGWLVIVATAEDVRLGQGHALVSALRRALQSRTSRTGVELPR